MRAGIQWVEIMEGRAGKIVAGRAAVEDAGRIGGSISNRGASFTSLLEAQKQLHRVLNNRNRIHLFWSFSCYCGPSSTSDEFRFRRAAYTENFSHSHFRELAKQ